MAWCHDLCIKSAVGSCRSLKPALADAGNTTCSAAFGVEQSATCFGDLSTNAVTTKNCATYSADVYLVKREPLQELALAAQDLQRHCQNIALEVCARAHKKFHIHGCCRACA
jgi:hypothetical protein